VTLAIFDLDNTLIAGDSDHLWGQFLCRHGLVDADSFAAQNDRFYADYQRGELDIHAYLDFVLAPCAGAAPPISRRCRRRLSRSVSATSCCPPPTRC
jgi:phosphoserine phosphatase